MDDNVLELMVVCADGRSIRVDVRFETPLAKSREDSLESQTPGEEALPVHGITDDDLKTREALWRFLANVTRPLAQGDHVAVSCWTTYKDRVYECLGITGGSPEPVEVKVGAHG